MQRRVLDSMFRSRRKAIKIQVNEDDDQNANHSLSPLTNQTSSPDKQHRKISDTSSTQKKKGDTDDEVDDNTDKNAIINASTEQKAEELSSIVKKKKERKKKELATKLSFGFGEFISDENAEASDEKNIPASSATIIRRVTKTTKFQKGISFQSLPGKLTENYSERPIYSKDYLNELKNSTPVRHQRSDNSLEPSQNPDEIVASQIEESPKADLEISTNAVPSEAEIREKKERRARLAREADFISFDEASKDHYTLLIPQRKQKETRLVPDDEDFAEGFDEFVEDEHISLGRKQTKQAQNCKRKEMAEMIEQAEQNSDQLSDDSEAERCVAYEIAQTRAGMDGLSKHELDDDTVTTQIPARITPLPSLSECLNSFQNTLDIMEVELDRKRRELINAEKEERDIEQREIELQALLKQAGERLAVIKSGTAATTTTTDQGPITLVSDSTASSTMVDRGLENYGLDNKLY